MATLTRSEREAQLKDKAGFIIVIIAVLLALCTYFSSQNSSKILTNTIEANNTYSFYQAKSIKGTLAEMALDDAVARHDVQKADKLKAKITRYESEPETNEGKRELLAKAKALEAERAEARKHSKYYTFTAMLYQIAIVFLTASILAVNHKLFYGSLVTAVIATLLFTQALWLWLPL
jgi:hypothetical protein